MAKDAGTKEKHDDIAVERLTEEESARILKEQREKHVTYADPIIPKWATITIDEDVNLGVLGITLPKGAYFMPPIDEDPNLVLHVMDVKQLAENVAEAEAAAEVLPDGTMRSTTEGDGPVEVKVNLRPVVAKVNNYLVTIMDAIAWYAINETLERQGKEEAQRLFRSLYTVGVGEKRGDLANQQDIQLAQYARTVTMQNHDISLKTLNEGLVEVAESGEYKWKPKRGTSKEKAILTGSPKETRAFLELGGNAEIVKVIQQTVDTLKGDPRAKEAATGGRVWFTATKICEEALRTDSGTIRGKNAEASQLLVESALVALSGMRVKTLSPDGKTENVAYLLNAERRETLRYNGNTYHDVWGLPLDTPSLMQGAQDKQRANVYPLLPREKPHTWGTASAENYLSDALHEARGKLYPKGKNRAPKSCTIKRSWDGIFSRKSPSKPLSSRKKASTVSEFEEALTALVAQEAHGERVEGKPLYIYAYSERVAGRGSGGGAWKNLVLEVSRELHAVRDGKDGRGSVDLHGGAESKKPNRRR